MPKTATAVKSGTSTDVKSATDWLRDHATASARADMARYGINIEQGLRRSDASDPGARETTRSESRAGPRPVENWMVEARLLAA